ncbi:hypothetical protein ACIQXD_29830 [Streptomyces uncialis]|uniref:hypothetical protein n=1 Tax=Streptomyces uncialis TaxID=1048205 RepID=UPI003800878E
MPTELSDEATSLYRRAAREPIERSGAPAFAELLDLGLIAKSPFGDKYTAISGVSAERAQVRDAANVLGALMARLKRVTGASEHISSMMETGPDGTGIECLVGTDLINTRVQQATQETQNESRSAQPGPRLQRHLKLVTGRDLDMAKRGVRMRATYRSTRRHDPAVIDYVRALSPRGLQVRTLRWAFPKVVILDDRHAFVVDADEWEQPNAARCWHVTHRPLVRFLAAVYDRDWDCADPWDSEPEAAPELVTSVRQRAILRELYAGRTQAQAAARVGVSSSVVTTEMHDLRAKLGLETNWQLGPWWESSPDRHKV